MTERSSPSLYPLEFFHQPSEMGTRCKLFLTGAPEGEAVSYAVQAPNSSSFVHAVHNTANGELTFDFVHLNDWEARRGLGTLLVHTMLQELITRGATKAQAEYKQDYTQARVGLLADRLVGRPNVTRLELDNEYARASIDLTSDEVRERLVNYIPPRFLVSELNPNTLD